MSAASPAAFDSSRVGVDALGSGVPSESPTRPLVLPRWPNQRRQQDHEIHSIARSSTPFARHNSRSADSLPPVETKRWTPIREGLTFRERRETSTIRSIALGVRLLGTRFLLANDGSSVQICNHPQRQASLVERVLVAATPAATRPLAGSPSPGSRCPASFGPPSRW